VPLVNGFEIFFGKPEINMAKCNRPDPHLTIGKGGIDWSRVIHSLENSNYSGYFEIERSPNDLEDSLQYLNKLN
jgi:sugar phosphate isomerase/epimerase